MNKTQRQEAIGELINTQSIATQEELLLALEKIGVNATQATISRDIREMGLVKKQDAQGKTRYVIFQGTPVSPLVQLQRSFAEVSLSVMRVEFMTIIKTLPSNGNLLAALIDAMQFPQVAGTLAGHDTIAVIGVNEDAAKWFEQQCNERFANYKI